MKKNNTLLEIERIENELKNNYGVEIVKNNIFHPHGLKWFFQRKNGIN